MESRGHGDPASLPDVPESGVADDGMAGRFFCVPSRPARPGDRTVDLELYRDGDGRPLLLAYTSRELLEAGCGPHQAAVVIPAERLADVAEEAGAAGVAFDPVLAEDARRTKPVADWRRRPERRRTVDWKSKWTGLEE
ncbi:type III secretion system (T3SS) SseB-like protein [Herbihabitans rhizosphaerae]|uniref:Type III secretion system (T3SS) SseB-like protein n=1 Tax=Herbihabitans rhizosphaerae TaxID=1872711 RepID=A0A4Q7KP35_9PSEU|nr:SAV_915 family protein [Herbihabitans rhizosphaerae]RZS37002.1 type III secretion system (T3SS) SseB-like protein [Herbihabitans rhizosphaerae]